MQEVLEAAETLVEESWQQQEAAAHVVSVPVRQRWYGRLLTWITSRKTERGPLEGRPSQMYAIDYLARDYPDIYIHATRG
jgi:hypothetical protein